MGQALRVPTTPLCADLSQEIVADAKRLIDGCLIPGVIDCAVFYARGCADTACRLGHITGEERNAILAAVQGEANSAKLTLTAQLEAARRAA